MGGRSRERGRRGGSKLAVDSQVVDIFQHLQELYTEMDGHGLDHLLRSNVELMLQHWGEVVQGISIVRPAERSKLSERQVRTRSPLRVPSPSPPVHVPLPCWHTAGWRAAPQLLRLWNASPNCRRQAGPPLPPEPQDVSPSFRGSLKANVAATILPNHRTRLLLQPRAVLFARLLMQGLGLCDLSVSTPRGP